MGKPYHHILSGILNDVKSTAEIYLVIQEFDTLEQVVVLSHMVLLIAVGNPVQVGEVSVQVHVVGIGPTNEVVLASLKTTIKISISEMSFYTLSPCGR